MSRILLLLSLALPLSLNAASLKELELQKQLQQVAEQSSQGTPRAINDDILDLGYSAQGNQLINHLSVRSAHAEQMRANPKAVRQQLLASVCQNSGFRQLLNQGAVLVYQFSEHPDKQPVALERFQQSDCQ